MSDALTRLKKFLLENGYPTREITALSPDASTREYFRIRVGDQTAVACVYPNENDPAVKVYLDVTHLFSLAALPVAKIIQADLTSGVIIQEDLGNLPLSAFIRSAAVEEVGRRLDEAISLIARIQSSTKLAISIDSIAARQSFDFDKLLWELDFFYSHYLGTLRKIDLPQDRRNAIYDEFRKIARSLGEKAAVLCHRDFHANNLMIDAAGNLRIIDHQDARLGSPTYDLVSLLLDRVTQPPDRDWILTKQAELLSERMRLGLPKIDPEEFDGEFRLQAVQRCLKAVGTFSYQASVRGKREYIQFIQAMLEIALDSARSLGNLPALCDFLDAEVTKPANSPPANS